MASVVGLFLGLVLAKGLNALFVAIGLDLPKGGTVFATRTIVVSLLVGVVVTLLASLRPAIRATRVPPIAAVREGATLPPVAARALGPPSSSIVTLVARDPAARLRDLRPRPHDCQPARLARRSATLILFVGVAMNAKRARAAARLRPRLARGTRIGGTAGALARENAMRNPSRTASTASALMIGLALITFVAILGQGLRTSFGDAVDKLFVADYAVTAAERLRPVQRGGRRGRRGDAGRRPPSRRSAAATAAFDGNIEVTAVPPNIGADASGSTGSRAARACRRSSGRTAPSSTRSTPKDHDLTIGSPIASRRRPARCSTSRSRASSNRRTAARPSAT